MTTIETRDEKLQETVGSYVLPDYMAKDSKFFSILLDLEEEEGEGETMNVIVNDKYFKKALEYYEHYKEYFKGEVKVEEKDKFDVVTRLMMNKSVTATRKITRRNDIPTEVFYVDTKKAIKEKQRLELANEQSMLNLEEFTEKWMNSFEREFVKDFHWKSPNSEKYPKESDGVETKNENDASSGAAISYEKLSLKRMLDYSDYLQLNSLYKFLNQWVNTNMASKTTAEVYEMCGMAYDGDIGVPAQ